MKPLPSRPVAVVTDSTACLPEELIAEYGIQVVPIHVVIRGVFNREGDDVSSNDVARALRERRSSVTTSRPNPEQFSQVYAELFAGGAPAVVSLHVSGKLSGTVETAEVAARDFGDRVVVVDSRSTAMGLGFPVLAAAERAASGGSLADVRTAVNEAVTRTSILFYVDTLEFLRRGGRIGAAEALLGTALSVKPILHVVNGEVVVKEKVRTAARALARLDELAVAAAGTGAIDVAVHHLDAAQRAADLADHLRGRLPDLRSLYTSELGAAVAAHVGPGVVAVVVSRRD